MSLDVYLYESRIGTLFPAGDNDYRFAYDPERLEQLGPGVGLLSNSLPVRREPFSAEATRAYVEGLLPSGPRRARIGRELGIDAEDGYLLLAELGADCPGAVSFVPEGEEVVARGPEEIAWLGDDELEELLRPPPPAYFSDDSPHRMRATLPGVRHKLSLVYDEANDRWGWPEAGVPSTHIVKPDSGEFPGLLANELFCQEAFREIGLDVVGATLREIAGRRCLVWPRYDRVDHGPGTTRRRHCETLPQALGIAPFAPEGSAEAEAPRYREVLGLIDAVGDDVDLMGVLMVALCNHVIGNGDAHGRNLYVIDDGRTELSGKPPGPMRIAPIGDVVSTVVYDDPIHTGMTVAEEFGQPATVLELGFICDECDLPLEAISMVTRTVCGEVSRAAEMIGTRAVLEGWNEPIVEKLVELATGRSLELGFEVEP